MKLSKNDVRSSARSIPAIRFEDQALTSFGGAVIYQALFNVLNLKERLEACVRHVGSSASYSLRHVLNLLVVHLLLGWRRLSELAYYRDDPIVGRLVGLNRLPTVATLSRRLRDMTPRVVGRLRELLRSLVMTRVEQCGLQRLTVDFDGSVISTKSRNTEGTAVGFNKKAKGERSYYPLLATVAQTGQVLDILHRPGNVHDSREALEFIDATLTHIREAGFQGKLEARLDSAHFSDDTCFWLDERRVDFSVSVPFERFPQLKQRIQSRKNWHPIDDRWSFFETQWKPKSWNQGFRVIIFRQRIKVPRKGPIQLDLFEPFDWQHEYKAVMTNKGETAKAILAFHNGRGSQEGIFAELKSQLNVDYIPTRRLIGNQVYLLCGLLAHNVNRELQMLLESPVRGTTLKRTCLWIFEKASTLRQRLIQRPGRITRPNGQLTLTLAANKQTAGDIERYLDALQAA
jgi:hypothetical protein